MAIEEIADQLYGLPPAEFTRTRDEAAGELRKAGRRDEAERVKALRKPTAAAAAANRLVRERRDEVERFLQAATVLRDAQFSGKGDLAAATRQEREELERLVGRGGEVVRQTLLAAAADEDAARQLLEGRLERELEPVGFGTLLAYVRPAADRSSGDSETPTEPAPPRPESTKRDVDGARARLQATKAPISTAETEERGARRRSESAQGELVKARADVEKARAQLDQARADVERAQARLDQARADVERARTGLERARAEAESARAQAEQARAAAEKAQRDLDRLDGR